MRKIENRMVDGAADLLASLPYDEIDTVLDIGMGNGYSTQYMEDQGVESVGTCLGVDHWDDGQEIGSDSSVTQADVETLPFTSGTFEAVWLSHVLEHVSNMGQTLSEIRRVLGDDGYFFVSVPPYKPLVVGGHMNTGWTPGQLLYVLLVHGFDIHEAECYYHGYNVHARVQRMSDDKFDEVQKRRTYDGPELDRLREYFPVKIQEEMRDDGPFMGTTEVRSTDDEGKGFKSKLDPILTYLNNSIPWGPRLPKIE